MHDGVVANQSRSDRDKVKLLGYVPL